MKEIIEKIESDLQSALQGFVALGTAYGQMQTQIKALQAQLNQLKGTSVRGLIVDQDGGDIDGVIIWLDPRNDSTRQPADLFTTSINGEWELIVPEVSSIARIRCELPAGYTQLSPKRNFGLALDSTVRNFVLQRDAILVTTTGVVLHDGDALDNVAFKLPQNGRAISVASKADVKIGTAVLLSGYTLLHETGDGQVIEAEKLILGGPHNYGILPSGGPTDLTIKMITNLWEGKRHENWPGDRVEGAIRLLGVGKADITMDLVYTAASVRVMHGKDVTLRGRFVGEEIACGPLDEGDGGMRLGVDRWITRSDKQVDGVKPADVDMNATMLKREQMLALRLEKCVLAGVEGEFSINALAGAVIEYRGEQSEWRIPTGRWPLNLKGGWSYPPKKWRLNDDPRPAVVLTFYGTINIIDLARNAPITGDLPREVWRKLLVTNGELPDTIQIHPTAFMTWNGHRLLP